jgi:drug/metabolite transporter (DMT)-like permease
MNWAVLIAALAAVIIFGGSSVATKVAVSAISAIDVSIMRTAIGVTIVAYILWYWALGTGGIAQVGLFQFLQPVSGVILAWLILAENLSLIFILASSIIMFGVVLAFRAR